MKFVKKYERRAEAVNSLVCVGLDSDTGQLPKRFQKIHSPQFAFNRWVIGETHPFTSAYKCNLAFYEAEGEKGLHDLGKTMAFLHQHHPEIVTIADAKRGDISSTNAAYVRAIFDGLGFDAVTLHPYLGKEALQPFLERKDKGCIIVCRTSNPGAGEFQDLVIGNKPLWQVAAETVADDWNKRGNCLLVVGATYLEELSVVRQMVGEMTLLVPGIGAQGGDLEKVVRVGLNSHGKGLIINSSRQVIFSADPGAAARSLRDKINQWRR